MSNKVEDFYKRWNVDYNEEKQFSQFKNRIINTIDNCLGDDFLEREELREQYLRYLAPKVEISSSKIYHPGLMDATEFRKLFNLAGHTAYFSNTKIWKVLEQIDNYKEFVKAIQAVDWLEGLSKSKKEEFFKEVKEDIAISPGIDINVEFIEESTVLYPKGAEELDEGTVNEVLRWLSKYPEAQDNFQNALSSYGSGANPRNILDDLRLALETLFREVLNNKKRLKKQKKPLGQFQKNKGVPKYIREMYTGLIRLYADYQNENVKHKSKVEDREVEFIIYLTGTFMRYLIKVGKH